MLDESRIAALALLYDTIIPVDDRYYIVSDGKKSGVIDSDNGALIIPIEYSEFRVEYFGEVDYATLTNAMTGESVIFNPSCGRFAKFNDTYRIGSKFNGLLVVNQIRTSSGFKRTAVIRESDMQVIVEPTKMKTIGPTMHIGCRAAMTYIDDGLKIDGVAYFIDDNYRVIAHHIGK